WQDLDQEIRDALLHGTGDRLFSFKLTGGNRKPTIVPFEGVIADLRKTRAETSSDGLRARLMAYQVGSVCPDCEGDRLNAAARSVRLGGLGFTDFMRKNLAEALDFVRGVKPRSVVPE